MRSDIPERGNRRHRFLAWLIVLNVVLFFFTAGLKWLGINVTVFGYVVLVPMQALLALTILVAVVMAVRKAVSAKGKEQAAAAIEGNTDGGGWICWVMGTLLVLCIVVMIPAVGVADLSEFGALGVLFVLLAISPVVTVVSIVMPFFAPKRHSTALDWIRSGILVSVIIAWLVFALRTGMLG